MIHISHVAVEFAFDEVAAPGMQAELLRRWAGCRTPVIPTRHRTTLVLEPDPQGDFRTRIDGVTFPQRHPASIHLKAAETCLYDRFIPWHREAGALLMHTGMMVHRGRGVVFAAPSGGGKSSLCLAALQRGWRYFTDDLTATDGRRFWGVPRALQFDPVPRGAAVIDRLAHLPRFEWVLGPASDPVEQPALVVPDEQRADAPVAVGDVHVVTVAQGNDDQIRALGPGETAAALVTAAFEWPAGPVRWVGGLRPGYALTWATPETALDLLESCLFEDA